MTSAETAYLFRHALVRDAAYQLQAPSGRATLHELAFYLIEEVSGGRAPEPSPLKVGEAGSRVPHSSDVVALELADHAAQMQSPALLRHYLQRAAEYAQVHHQNAQALELWQRLATVADPPQARGAHFRAAKAAWLDGRIEQAEAEYGQLSSDPGVTGDAGPQAEVLAGLAVLYGATGRTVPAEEAIQSALGLQRELGDRGREGIFMLTLGNIYYSTGRLPLAETTYMQALERLVESGNRHSESIGLVNLANVYRDTGRLAEAEKALLDGLEIHRVTGDQRGEGIIRTNLAGIYMRQGRLDEAERLLREALQANRQCGNRAFENGVVFGMAEVCLAREQLPRAETLFEQALALACERGDAGDQAIAWANLGHIYSDQGRLGAARQALSRAVAYFEFSNDPWRQGLSRFNLARLHASNGQPAEADSEFGLAIALLMKVGDELAAGDAECGWALYQLGRRDHSALAEAWRQGAARVRKAAPPEKLTRLATEMREACAKAGVPPFDEGRP